MPLTQVHRRFPCPPFIDPFVLLLLAVHQPIAYQDAVRGGSRRCLVADFALHFEGDSSGTTASVVSAHFANQRFDIRSDPTGAGMRAAGLISQLV